MEELLNKLNDFYIYCNEGFYIDKIINKNDYVIAYSKDIKDYDCNYVTNLKISTKEQFGKIDKEIKKEFKNLGKEVCYIVSPINKELYEKRKEIFETSGYKEVNNEVWQIYDDLDNLQIEQNSNISLEIVDNMEKMGILNHECFSTGDPEDPYGKLDNGYNDIYRRYKPDLDSKYSHKFYYIKYNNEIVGVSVSAFGDGICGIYGLAVKKEYRGKGIGKEALKLQMKKCKEKNIKLVFLQTEEGYYPAKTYRKIGFKDVCNVYFYALK